MYLTTKLLKTGIYYIIFTDILIFVIFLGIRLSACLGQVFHLLPTLHEAFGWDSVQRAYQTENKVVFMKCVSLKSYFQQLLEDITHCKCMRPSQRRWRLVVSKVSIILKYPWSKFYDLMKIKSSAVDNP
jgi:hypothetical protein